mmetsp:Transcript_14347/g.24908  ORF Transcript_14347/g.24908 Transcript_14347/m.24908 type:complete len:230 (+) Transcript_14347:487-1176(+)
MVICRPNSLPHHGSCVPFKKSGTTFFPEFLCKVVINIWIIKDPLPFEGEGFAQERRQEVARLRNLEFQRHTALARDVSHREREIVEARIAEDVGANVVANSRTAVATHRAAAAAAAAGGGGGGGNLPPPQNARETYIRSVFDGTNTGVVCALCQDDPTLNHGNPVPYVTPNVCDHVYHQQCMQGHIDHYEAAVADGSRPANDLRCPICRGVFQNMVMCTDLELGRTNPN